MELRPFSLVPFPDETIPAGLSVAGAIGRDTDTLSIRYLLSGDLSSLAILPTAAKPKRRERLWEKSCFEFFIGEMEPEGYLEFNLSPAGHWNIYRFDSYRQGMREEETVTALPFLVHREPNALTVTLAVEIGKLFPPGRPLRCGIAAIVRTASGGTTHWALAHPGPRPDFHRPDAFLLDLIG